MENTTYRYPIVAETTICDDGTVILRINAHESDTGHYRGTNWHYNATPAQVARFLNWANSNGRYVGSCSSGVAGWYKQVVR